MKPESNQTTNRAEEHSSVSLQNIDESFGLKFKMLSSARHVNFKHLLQGAFSDSPITIKVNVDMDNSGESPANSFHEGHCIRRNNSENIK